MGRNNDSQSTQDNSSKLLKAVWNKKITHIFCDVCVRAIEKGFRPGTHFDKQGWTFVVQEFQKNSDCKYDKHQLKNKWDALKKDWKQWKELLGRATGLGWDPVKETIIASEEWWEEQIKVNSAIKNFRQAGIEPELQRKLDVMFGDTVATGEYADAPSSIALGNNSNIEAEYFTQGNNDAFEVGDDFDGEPSFVDSIDILFRGSNEQEGNENIGTNDASRRKETNKKRAANSNFYLKKGSKGNDTKRLSRESVT